MAPSIASRCRCLPIVNGEADRLTTHEAPAADEIADGVDVVAPPPPEVAVVPDVLADRHPEPPAAPRQGPAARRPARSSGLRRRRRRWAAASCETPAAPRRRPAAPRRCRAAVPGALVGLGQPEQQRRPRGQPPRQLLAHRPAARHERAPQEQVAGRIAQQRRAPRRPPDRRRRAAPRRPPRPAARRCPRGRPRSGRSAEARSSCRARYHAVALPLGGRAAASSSHRPQGDPCGSPKISSGRQRQNREGEARTDDSRRRTGAGGAASRRRRRPAARPSSARRAGPWRSPSLPSSS